jgi:Bacterial EndoU nuclease
MDFNNFGVCNITAAANGESIYTASCTKAGGNGQRNSKASTFFPDNWDINRIRTEAAHAFCHQIDINTVPGAAGNCSWCGNAQTQNIIIGGRGPKGGITTAFPAYNGSFI